jgi:aspartate aminotransferase-like enzyme
MTRVSRTRAEIASTDRLAASAWSEAEVCLLPGPVALSARVQAALCQPSLYHRGEEFVALFEKVRAQLGSLVGARDTAMFVGSGTLANDVVAATLAAVTPGRRGLILENGEFGRRLIAQAARFGLTPRVLSWPWGSAWDADRLAAALDQEPPDGWVWGVHHESSTGVLNDLPTLIRLARRRGVRVCVDCVSSVGAVPLDLSEVFLASGTSGKALGACSGIALVFANRDELQRLDTTRVPSYFDLAATLASRGPCFTFPSLLLQALAAALTRYDTPARAVVRYESYAALGRHVRQHLRRLGLQPLAGECHSGPTIATFAPPAGWTAPAFVDLCRSWGFLIGGQSGYLAERRLVQIATMGAITAEACTPLFKDLELMEIRPAADMPAKK